MGLPRVNVRFIETTPRFGLSLAEHTIPQRVMAGLVPISLLSRVSDFSEGAIPILTWGGLKGGISVALALSPPESVYKDTDTLLSRGPIHHPGAGAHDAVACAEVLSTGRSASFIGEPMSAEVLPLNAHV